MKHKPLQPDLFLYEFAIRMLGVLATILFSLLFFYGAIAATKSDFRPFKSHKPAAARVNLQGEATEYSPLGDIH